MFSEHMSSVFGVFWIVCGVFVEYSLNVDSVESDVCFRNVFLMYLFWIVCGVFVVYYRFSGVFWKCIGFYV